MKSGSASLASNYRPISLTCTCSKLMESIVSKYMLDYLLNNGLISDQQHEFISKRSACLQLLESFQDWILELSDKKCIDVIYLDFSKAFDSVFHNKLLHKLKSYGFCYELSARIKCFLNNRSQCVEIEGHHSGYVPVSSGMVQGSQIGPLLFIAFVNDIVDLVKDPVNCKLFADDVKLYSKIEATIDNTIDMTLRTIQEWSRKWQMNLNPSKSSTMTIGNDQTTKSYSIDNIEIPRVTNIRDLGLVYDTHLKI